MEFFEICRGGHEIMNKTNVLVTILGRGGSKGLPGKNVRPFLGAPLIGLSIYDALQVLEGISGISKTIAVDSDSREILDTANVYLRDAHTLHLRDAVLAEDSTPKTAAISKLVHDVEKGKNIVYDVIIDLDITSPLRTAEDMQMAFIHLLEHPSLDLVYSVVPARRNTYFNMVETCKDGESVQLVKEGSYTCRQDAPKVYEMNASVYVYRGSSLRNFRHFYDLRGGITIMKDYGVLDIDCLEDHKLMELIYKNICIHDNKYFYDKLSYAIGYGAE